MLAEFRFETSQLAHGVERDGLEFSRRLLYLGFGRSVLPDPTLEFFRIEAHIEPEFSVRDTPGPHPLIESLRANSEIVGRLIDAP